MTIELISYMGFFSLKVNNGDKNNNLFRVSALNILIPLNILHTLYTKILYREKKNQMSWPDPLVGLNHMAMVGKSSILSITNFVL